MNDSNTSKDMTMNYEALINRLEYAAQTVPICAEAAVAIETLHAVLGGQLMYNELTRDLIEKILSDDAPCGEPCDTRLKLHCIIYERDQLRKAVAP